MCLELETLSREFLDRKKNNSNLYVYDESEVKHIEFDNIHKEGLSLSMQLIKVNDVYKIFYIVSKLDKLKLIYLVDESYSNLSNKYQEILNFLNILNVDEFILKYCKKNA